MREPSRTTYLTSVEADAIAGRIAGIEGRTGVEVVVAVVGRADRYPEARWKAFALAVAFAALAVVLLEATQADWPDALGLLPAVVAILLAGAVNALVAMYAPRYARLYVRNNRAEAEVRQYAESLFLARSLHATPRREALLLVVAMLERVVVVHADRGFDVRIESGEWRRVVDQVVAGLRVGDVAHAVLAGLTATESLLAGKGYVGHGERANAVSDRPIEERGA
jgi:putative membrane protein